LDALAKRDGDAGSTLDELSGKFEDAHGSIAAREPQLNSLISENDVQNYGAKQMADSWRTVRKNTIQIAEEIPESKLDFSPAPGTRTVRQLLTHIALTDAFSGVHKEKRTSFEGINFPQLVGQMMAEEQKPRSKAELIAMLKERDERAKHREDRWLPAAILLGEAPRRRPNGAVDGVTRRRQALDRRQLAQRVRNGRQQHPPAPVQRLHAELAAAGHEHERRVDEAHVPARVAAGDLVVRGQQRAEMRVERGDDGLDGIGDGDVVDDPADPDASAGLVLIGAH